MKLDHYSRLVPTSLCVLASLLSQGTGPRLRAAEAEPPKWIWSATTADGQVVHFRKSFELPAAVKSAKLYATCDNRLQLWLNGRSAGDSPAWERPLDFDATKFLKAGANVIAARGQNEGGVAALVLRLEVTCANDAVVVVQTDATWRNHGPELAGWQNAGFDDAAWASSVVKGRLGDGPWNIPGKAAAGGGGRKGGGSPLNPEDIQLLPGFKAELLHTVSKDEQGSWVALTKDPKGRLIASDQGGKGLFRLTVGGSAEPAVKVEKIPVNLSGAQGMTWAFDSLYVHVSGRGLYRVRDTNGDDQLDSVEQLPGANGGGEHGNHAVIPTEDGEALYVVAGNHTNLPEVQGSRVPRNWGEDLLLPRQWDARGHARGRLAPGGWICRVTPDGQRYEVYGVGHRNQYDVALNRFGDLFTYDADMEWDLGMPWYRPTRICHVVSGSDYGWRSGTGKWPTYYEDSLPPVVDIGPGSPTGVVAGLGAKFPAKYQDAIYALDWTYGTIYAIHLEPDGAGYRGTREDFLSGIPLPVTDAVIGDDGAFYFAIGGRGAQSALYRVTYTGKESTTAIAAQSTPGSDSHAAARATRRKLEAFHGRVDAEAVETAWPHLSSPDRFFRHAARIAVESQPVETWANRALKEAHPQARVTALVALARQGTAEHRAPVTAALLEMKPASLSEGQLLGMLRAWQLTFIRLGKPTPAERERVIAQLDPVLPAASGDVNTELVNLLVYLEAPGIAGKSMRLIAGRGKAALPDWGRLIERNRGYGGAIQNLVDNPPPLPEISLAFALRNLRTGWTPGQRRDYFKFLNEVGQLKGGASFAGFLTNIRDEALGNCTNEERAALADLTGETFNPVADFPVHPPKGPGREWTLADASRYANSGQFSRANFESGRNLFHALACANCHRFAGLGGDIGPDLTSVRNKFDAGYVLESILEPGKVISDQYGSYEVRLKDGRALVGLVVERAAGLGTGAALDVYPPEPNSKAVRVNRTDVVSVKQSPVSQMPAGLLNLCNETEVRDLLAYILSGGNAKDRVYGKR